MIETESVSRRISAINGNLGLLAVAANDIEGEHVGVDFLADFVDELDGVASGT